MHIDTKQSRRTFLQRAAQLSAAGAAAPFLGSLGLMGEAAAAADTTGYKALVCVFLYGGNDHFNTIIPYDSASHSAYMATRPRLGVARGSLAGTALTAANNMGGRQFALHPSLQRLAPIFTRGDLAPVLNVGALVEPTTKAAYTSRAVRLPPKLFSHNDQTSYMQAFAPEGADAGWGGRMGDMIQASNGTASLTCISLRGRALWLSGNQVIPYTAQAGSMNGLLNGSRQVYGSGVAMDAMRQIITSQQQNSWIMQEHAKVVERAVGLSDTVADALSYAPASQFTTFANNGNLLADQLKMIARFIAVGPRLGLKRQVFFVGQGGYDTHSGQLKVHPGLLGQLGQAMSEFYAATAQLGVADRVTTFTMSDFGRALPDNGDGSDHGWGSHHLVMGGAVKGGQIYGTPPTMAINTNEDVVGGRFIPTTSIDQMAATLGQWFGLSASELPQIMPSLRNFSQTNLGFL